jgi:hypothetical protein
MQAKTGARTAETASLLESFGIELSAGGLVVMTDFVWSEAPTKPVAAAGACRADQFNAAPRMITSLCGCPPASRPSASADTWSRTIPQ